MNLQISYAELKTIMNRDTEKSHILLPYMCVLLHGFMRQFLPWKANWANKSLQPKPREWELIIAEAYADRRGHYTCTGLRARSTLWGGRKQSSRRDGQFRAASSCSARVSSSAAEGQAGGTRLDPPSQWACLLTFPSDLLLHLSVRDLFTNFIERNKKN